MRKVLQMLKDELELTMALMGVCSIKEICRNHVQIEHKYHTAVNSKL